MYFYRLAVNKTCSLLAHGMTTSTCKNLSLKFQNECWEYCKRYWGKYTFAALYAGL